MLQNLQTVGRGPDSGELSLPVSKSTEEDVHLTPSKSKKKSRKPSHQKNHKKTKESGRHPLGRIKSMQGSTSSSRLLFNSLEPKDCFDIYFAHIINLNTATNINIINRMNAFVDFLEIEKIALNTMQKKPFYPFFRALIQQHSKLLHSMDNRGTLCPLPQEPVYYQTPLDQLLGIYKYASTVLKFKNNEKERVKTLEVTFLHYHNIHAGQTLAESYMAKLQAIKMY